MKKIKLHGFNNLTKNLNFCIYDIYYTNSNIEKNKYIKYINKKYNANRLTKILKKTCNIIGAKILNIAKQNYYPQGASVTILISEEKIKKKKKIESKTILMHLNKSHICVHTYPESHPERKISTFRVDIEISTCGLISPLKALDFFISKLESDILTIDYKIRGFTRNINGKKIFIDHKINSIQNFINKKIKKKYDLMDINIYQENIFHTKMILKNINFNNYILNIKEINLKKKKKLFLFYEKKWKKYIMEKIFKFKKLIFHNYYL